MSITRRAMGAALLALPALHAARAQDFPNKPLRMVVPFPPGGSIDGLARMAAGPLGQAAGQTVVVDNRPGATGTIAGDLVARAAPDGTTLLFATMSTLLLAPFTVRTMPYDPQRAFAPIGLVSDSPQVILAHKDVPAGNLRELAELARQKPESISFASPGNGTLPHLTMERFCEAAGVRMLHVPYQGGSQQDTDAMTGRVQLTVGTTVNAATMMQNGAVKPLAVTSPARAASLPEVATVTEQGFPQIAITIWTALMAPAATPEPIQRRLSQILEKALDAPQTEADFARFGVTPRKLSGEGLARLLDGQREDWGATARRVASQAG